VTTTADDGHGLGSPASGAGGGRSVEVAGSLAGVEPSEWDALSGDNALATHGWLRTIDTEAREFGKLEPRYVTVRDSGRLVGAAAFYRCEPGSRHFLPDHLMFGRARSWLGHAGASFLPAMTLGPVRCLGRPLLVDESLEPSRRAQVRGELLDAVEAAARAEKLALHVPNLLADEQETQRLLRARGYHRTQQFPVCFIDIEWSSFDGYLDHLASFSGNMPRNVRKEMRRCRKAGIVLRQIDDPAAHDARLYELADRHYRKLNASALPYSPRFFAGLQENLGRDLVLYGAFRGGGLIGFSLMLRRRRVGYLPLLGIDPETEADSLYFSLCYYHPVADAVARGLKRLFVGRTNYHAKVRRGFRTMPVSSYYRAASRSRHQAMRPWFAFHAAWMSRRVAPLLDLARLRRYSAEPSRPSALTPPDERRR